jgi:hypothetical protein
MCSMPIFSQRTFCAMKLVGLEVRLTSVKSDRYLISHMCPPPLVFYILMCAGVRKVYVHSPALPVTVTLAGAVSCPLQRGEVLFLVPQRAGGDRNS